MERELVLITSWFLKVNYSLLFATGKINLSYTTLNFWHAQSNVFRTCSFGRNSAPGVRLTAVDSNEGDSICIINLARGSIYPKSFTLTLHFLAGLV